ncbi:hypothetical protein P691DRAFT_766599 [Macrolepiota fuliginosa MF-IS2]|uniref:Uncharacterized protein n=1 Tax=Macrolepiota fuliginosa MF-IS2 TaxID=1400762 RepID=A0A9P6BV36_9AGAR|nr:hypothetical protein P691DRAFT_766599 [Macrolepiota fuliginosa MF-IS2]
MVAALITLSGSMWDLIGFWNQTLPKLPNGGTWSQDLLWLELVTQCIDTNLMLNYSMSAVGIQGPVYSMDLNLTDYGGFVNLTYNISVPNRGGQHIDLVHHAYAGAVLGNEYTMQALNITRHSSFVGASYPVGNSSNYDRVGWDGSAVGVVNSLPVSYLNLTVHPGGETLCQGYDIGDIADGTNVNVECAIFLGPPQRTDNGNPQDYGLGSRWSQKIHSCASTTRASIQTVKFSTNSTTDLQSLHITRTLSGPNVLWATEKTNFTITKFDVFWGRVDDGAFVAESIGVPSLCYK